MQFAYVKALASTYFESVSRIPSWQNGWRIVFGGLRGRVHSRLWVGDGERERGRCRGCFCCTQHRGGIGQGLWPGNLFLSWSPSLLSDLAAPPLCATRTAQHICCRPCRALNNSRTLKGLTRKVIRLPYQSRHPPYREGVIPATSPQSVIIVIIFFSSKFGKKIEIVCIYTRDSARWLCMRPENSEELDWRKKK